MNNEFINIYNNLIKLARNKDLFYIFTNKDTFSDRILIFLFHFAFFLKSFKKSNNKKYMQNFFDYSMRQIELGLREIGYGDVSINKKMKNYINVLYSIIDKIHKWDDISDKDKKEILEFYINLKGNSDKLVKYFNNYEKYLIKTSFNLFTKSVINHKF
tara:strand:+ start:1218 stop:1691 length:474 start_codon:yes stop_codon:yes gene_type:complete